MAACLAVFLSRLCGGEGIHTYFFVQMGFLSRLCGGEVCSHADSFTVLFLSRLCGGEGLALAAIE